jgi:hypothetical protein
MKKTITLLLLATCLFACKRKKEDIIINTWQAVSMQNPTMDTIIMQQQMFIDTVGKNTDAAANLESYGTSNMDSFKKEMQTQLDSFKIMQENAIKSTEFQFLKGDKKGGKAIINLGGGDVDSCKWYFDDEGALVLDEMKLKGAGDKIKMEIVTLNDTIMTLRLNEQGSKSTVTFKPKKK